MINQASKFFEALLTGRKKKKAKCQVVRQDDAKPHRAMNCGPQALKAQTAESPHKSFKRSPHPHRIRRQVSLVTEAICFQPSRVRATRNTARKNRTFDRLPSATFQNQPSVPGLILKKRALSNPYLLFPGAVVRRLVRIPPDHSWPWKPAPPPCADSITPRILGISDRAASDRPRPS